MVAPSPRPVRSAAFAQAFRTFQANHRPELVRSCGSILQCADGAAPDVPDVLRHAPPDPALGCARGKAAAIVRRGALPEVTCFQISDCRSQASRIACCNATAAAAACEAERTGLRRLGLRVALPGRTRLRVECSVGPRSGSGTRAVGQIWHAVPLALGAPIREDGRHLVVCEGPLNDYLVVRTREGEAVHGFPLAEARALWRRFARVRDPLVSRMAVVASDAADRSVKFFSCGDREHPSAPPSGLAVLAITAQRLGWEGLRSAREVITPAGRIGMPRVRGLADGAATIEFPAILVALDGPAVAVA